MIKGDLKSKVKKGFVWSAIERFATQGIQFIFGIIIASLLSPEDYGIIAMPLVFLALAQVFIDSGFSNALVRKPQIEENDLSTAFYFNIVVGTICYGILFIASPWIANFYDTPILTNILKVTALATLFNPLCAVQQAILTKQIDFQTQAKVSVMAALISGIVGLVMAYMEYGVWALVFQQVVAALIRTILLWTLSKWKPVTGWSKKSFEYLWGYGSKILAVGILDTVFNNIYPMVIGKFYSAKDLGNYTRAQQFVDLPISNVTGILQRVTFPVLSAIQDEDERLKSNYLKLLRATAFVMFPLMLGLATLAEPLIFVLLGEKWLGCAVLLQILCLAKIWTPINAVNLNLLQVKGRSDLFLKLEVLKKGIIIIAMFITIPRGILWMVGGTVVTTFIAFVINTYYTQKFIYIGLLAQVRELIPIMVNTFFMVGCMSLLFCISDNMYFRLLGGIVVGGGIYMSIAYVLKLHALQDILLFAGKHTL
ncbi:lipopolysaccharide biosynthesis protein [Bacteroides sp.]|uniref:lipopolysaccharide biosynthesis protein n=1 Tax=Bacteroides sp. TaxID=29523 RepID=UPI002603BB03|nr:lipopolysaccharide biosynthesis protein [Bacteroides sp.]